jgi:co-chaperonin GroES (HSP10)
MNIKALYDHTLIKPLIIENKDSDLLVPDSIEDVALVISSENEYLVGNNVYFNSFGVKEYVIDGEKYYFIKNEDILGVCQNK